MSYLMEFGYTVVVGSIAVSSKCRSKKCVFLFVL